MSVLMQFSIFPTDKGASASVWVSRVIAMVRECGFEYRLSSMATVVETKTLAEAQEILQNAFALLEQDCERVYCTVTYDVRKGPLGRIEGKINSIEEKIGKVDQ